MFLFLGNLKVTCNEKMFCSDLNGSWVIISIAGEKCIYTIL